MNAIQIADSFDLFAIDHTPDGWPAVKQIQLTEAALMLRKQHEAIKKLRTALTKIERLGNKMDFSAVAEAKAALKSTGEIEK